MANAKRKKKVAAKKKKVAVAVMTADVPRTMRNKDAEIIRKVAERCVVRCMNQADDWADDTREEDIHGNISVDPDMVNMFCKDAQDWLNVYKNLTLAKPLTGKLAKRYLNRALRIWEGMDTANRELPWEVAKSNRERDALERFYGDNYFCIDCKAELDGSERDSEVCDKCLEENYD